MSPSMLPAAMRETLVLFRLGATRLPAPVDSCTVNSGDGMLRYEVFIERGQLTFTGIPASTYLSPAALQLPRQTGMYGSS